MLDSLFKLDFNKKWLLLLLFICLGSVITVVNGISNTTNPLVAVIQNVEHLVDADAQYTINNINDKSTKAWMTSSDHFTSFGVSDATYWTRFTITNPNLEQDWLLELDYPLLDTVDIWFKHNNNLLSSYQLGDTLPYTQRLINHEKFLAPVPATTSSIQVIIKSHSSGQMRLSTNIWRMHEYLTFSSEHNIVMGLFFGLLLAIGLSNLFFYLTTRSPLFLIYSIYVTCLAMSLMALYGLGYRYIWPEFPWLQQHAVSIFVNATLCMYLVFCNQLLGIAKYNKKLSQVFYITAAGIILSLLIGLVIPQKISVYILIIGVIVSNLLIVATGFWLWKLGVQIAKFFIFVWSILCGFVFLACVEHLGMLSFNLSTHYLLMLGAAIEVLLLALILAISHDQQKQSLLLTQGELLEKERQTSLAQTEMLTLQENAKEDLEYKVQERTLELEIALRELEDTNRELQEKNTLDSLTGIRNRNYFDKKYQAELRRSRREQTTLSVVMVDIDHFKAVNDQYGHLVGDECIKFVADTLQQALKRPSDDVCRYGGEEFALILPNTDLSGAIALIEKIRQTIADTPITVDDISINLKISAGVGTAIVDNNLPEEAILALADKQLYKAKSAGRNNVSGSDTF